MLLSIKKKTLTNSINTQKIVDEINIDTKFIICSVKTSERKSSLRPTNLRFKPQKYDVVQSFLIAKS